MVFWLWVQCHVSRVGRIWGLGFGYGASKRFRVFSVFRDSGFRVEG